MSIIRPIRNPMRAAMGLEASGPSGPPLGEQLTNFDFETGDFTGWSQTVGSPNGYVTLVNNYTSDAPHFGFALTGMPAGAAEGLTANNDANKETVKPSVSQSIAIVDTVNWELSVLTSGSFSNTWGAATVAFEDGGGSPVGQQFKNSFFGNQSPNSYIRASTAGYILGGATWKEDFTYLLSYRVDDPTKIMVYDSGWKFITTDGWTTDDLVANAALPGTYAVDFASSTGTFSSGGFFYPNTNGADFAYFSDDWIAGGFCLASRAGYSGTTGILPVPAGAVTAIVRSELNAANNITDYISFVTS